MDAGLSISSASPFIATFDFVPAVATSTSGLGSSVLGTCLSLSLSLWATSFSATAGISADGAFAGPIFSASGSTSSAAGIGPSSLAARALSASSSSGVISRGISGTSPGSCPAGAGSFTVNARLDPLLPLALVLRKSRNVAAEPKSSGSGSGSSFFFLDGKRSRLFHPVSASLLVSGSRPMPSPPNRSTPETDALKWEPSPCGGMMRSSSRVIAVSNSLASKGFTMCPSARTRRDSSGLNGSSFPTVNKTGMCAVSAASFSRWHTSRPLYPGM